MSTDNTEKHTHWTVRGLHDMPKSNRSDSWRISCVRSQRSRIRIFSFVDQTFLSWFVRHSFLQRNISRSLCLVRSSLIVMFLVSGFSLHFWKFFTRQNLTSALFSLAIICLGVDRLWGRLTLWETKTSSGWSGTVKVIGKLDSNI